jgi:hypothetical protein
VVLDNLTTGFDWAVPPGATLIIGDAGDQSRVGGLIAAHRMATQGERRSSPNGPAESYSNEKISVPIQFQCGLRW